LKYFLGQSPSSVLKGGEIMKKILLSLVTIAVVSGLVGVTAAYWNSTATAESNTFSTGTLDLQANEQKTVTAVFGGDKLAPGNWIPEQSLNIENKGTLDGNHLDLLVTLSGDTDLAKYIVYSNNSNGFRFGADKTGPQSVRFDVPGWTAGDDEYGLFNGTDGSYITGPNAVAPRPAGSGNGMDRDGDGKVTLADMAAGKIRISPGTVNAGIAAGTSATLWTNAQLDSGTPNEMQGKSVVATFTWTLDQDASQY
jgi:predicted ribosomally synthesized peptide with SipW-like signal peptide